jgi:hypothetical protein
VTDDLARFYDLLAGLEGRPGQGRALAEYDGRAGWPPRGVYFFREPGENRAGAGTARVVRVGTHAVSTGSRSTLWQRLRAHKGQRSGGGNHRGSVFRLHVGAALLVQDGSGELRYWGKESSAPREVRDAEAAHELRVSGHIGGMTVLWLDVDDEPGRSSLRSYIERNAIALLSNQRRPADPPSPCWLGRFSPRQEIRESGLWNLNYIDDRYDPTFLDVLEDMGGRSAPVIQP